MSEMIPLALGAICVLATLGFLRVLACFRQHQVDTHDTAREARRLRRDYSSKIAEEPKEDLYF